MPGVAAGRSEGASAGSSTRPGSASARRSRSTAATWISPLGPSGCSAGRAARGRSPSTGRSWRPWLRTGRGAAHHPAPRSEALFLTELRATRLRYPTVNIAFRQLRRALHWRQEPLPTTHDLRHSFAVRTFLAWIRAGKDVDAELPALSAYMGHAHPSCTYWYLTAIPELVHLVTGHTERFARLQTWGDA